MSSNRRILAADTERAKLLIFYLRARYSRDAFDHHDAPPKPRDIMLAMNPNTQEWTKARIAGYDEDIDLLRIRIGAQQENRQDGEAKIADLQKAKEDLLHTLTGEGKSEVRW